MNVNHASVQSSILIGAIFGILASARIMAGCAGEVASCSQAGDGREIVVGDVRFRVASITAERSAFRSRTIVFLSPSRDVCLGRLGGPEATSAQGLLSLHIPIGLGHYGVAYPSADLSKAAASISDATNSEAHSDVHLATAGNIDVTRFIPDQEIAGSYDLTFATGERLTGAFDTSFCDTRKCK